MKKILDFLFNVVWVITGGLISAILLFVMGLLTFIMIIPIFFGIPWIYFKAIPLAFAPAGKKVILHFERAVIRNVLWLIFGGLLSAILHFVVGIALCCTVVGIPWGLQMFKFAKFLFAPFKADVIAA